MSNTYPINSGDPIKRAVDELVRALSSNAQPPGLAPNQLPPRSDLVERAIMQAYQSISQAKTKSYVRRGLTQQELPVIPEGGGAFQVTNAWFIHEDGVVEAAKRIRFLIHNRSQAWISPDILRYAGGILTPGFHIADGADWDVSEAIQPYLNGQTRIKRWRPGFLTVPGDGGGDVTFELPGDATSAFIELTVVG